MFQINSCFGLKPKKTPKQLFFLQSWPKRLSTNQVAVFFDHQDLWKESIGTLDFLYGDNNQGKVDSEKATFGWVWPVVPVI